MAFEALNHAGGEGANLLVILNDNDMSIAPPVGGLSAYLSRLVSSSEYLGLRSLASKLARKLSRRIHNAAAKAEEYARGMAMGGTLFEELGFYYVGPIDGHNLDHLIPVLENVRDMAEGPCLIHVVTKKGHGHPFPGPDSEHYHAVSKFDPVTLEFKATKANAPTFTQVFASSLIAAAERDPRLVAITAAMPSGTGLDIFAERFPNRTFDVGIAEQHAVTFAAGLAADGMKPFCALYSTFLQRGYDQVVHDVAIQSLPVRFAIDRAGLVGADGPTHAGSFDIGYLGALPGFVVMAAADEVSIVVHGISATPLMAWHQARRARSAAGARRCGARATRTAHRAPHAADRPTSFPGTAMSPRLARRPASIPRAPCAAPRGTGLFRQPAARRARRATASRCRDRSGCGRAWRYRPPPALRGVW